MLSESSVRDSQLSPDSPHSPRQNGSPSTFKGKKPMYLHRPTSNPQDLQPAAGQSEDGSDPAPKPSLLSRMSPAKQPLSARIRSPENVGQASSLADRIAPAAEEEGEILADEGENSPVASGKLQGTPHARSTSSTTGARVKAEETIPVILPSMSARRMAGRKRGSRSTIDVFGNPTDPTEVPESEEITSPSRPLRRESILHGFGTILVDIGQTLPDHTHVDADSSTAAELASGSSNQEPLIASNVPALSASTSFESTSSRGIPTTPVATAAPSRVTTSILSAPSTPSLQPRPSPFPTTVLQQCRNLMIPLIDRNAKLRKPDVDEALVKRRALSLLSDDKCAEIIRLAREVRKQMQGGQKRDRDSSDEPPEPPAKVPRVSSESDVVDTVTVGKDRVPSKRPSPLVPGTADVAITAVDSADETPGVPADPITADASVLPPQLHVVQSPLSPHAAIPSNTDPNLAIDPQLDVLSTDTTTDVEMQVLSLGASDMPPATRTARSRTPSGHAPGPVGGASSSSTTSTTPPDPEARLISRTSSPPQATPVIAEATTQPETVVLSTSTDTSRHEDVTPLNINVPPEHERVAHPSDNIDDDISMDPKNQDLLEEQPPVPSIVPGLWAAVTGRPSAGIEKIEFFVDDATADAARCWARRQESFSLDDRHVAVHLLCLPQASVTSIVEDLGDNATPADIVAALWNLKADWPSPGSLVVQAGPSSQKDPSHPLGSAWLPSDLRPGLGHLDITSCIGPGKNVINLIQLQGMSDHFFAVHATEPSQNQRETVNAETYAWSHLSKWRPQRQPTLPFQRSLLA